MLLGHAGLTLSRQCSDQVLLLLVLLCQRAGPWETSDSRELWRRRLLLLLRLLLGWGKFQEGLDCHCNLAQPFLF